MYGFALLHVCATTLKESGVSTANPQVQFSEGGNPPPPTKYTPAHVILESYVSNDL